MFGQETNPPTVRTQSVFQAQIFNEVAEPIVQNVLAGYKGAHIPIYVLTFRSFVFVDLKFLTYFGKEGSGSPAGGGFF